MREESLAPWLGAFAEAKARGEIAAEAEPRLLTQMILATTMVRLELAERLDTRMLTTIVRITLQGARPSVSSARSRSNTRR